MAVALSTPSLDDRDEFLEAVLASRALHAPWVDPPDTAERFDEYLERVRRPNQVCYLLRHSTCGGLIGFVNVNNVVLGAFRSGQLGYGAFSLHAGQGLMTEGLRAVLDDAFGRVGLHRLEANIQPPNARSIALVRRLGFEEEGFSARYLMVDGEWRDHQRWAITVEQWRP
ncbi:MAG: GNAT family N-acetyltransferase [Acidimicrobiales bacterium]